MDLENVTNVSDLINKLSQLENKEATKELTRYYANARFKMGTEYFEVYFTDGPNDGGVDFYYNEDNTFFIFQTKYSANPKRVNSSEILDELRKIKNALTNENPNKKAESFINSLKRETGNKNAVLEIIWLTTNIVEQSVRDEIQKDLESWKENNGWILEIDFIAIDKRDLERVIYDVKHGYIPYTGKRTLKLEEGQWIGISSDETGIHSIVCIVNVNDILKWFSSIEEIDKFLQKNVRDFLGETRINKAIQRSYLEAPAWFWYKHNGIIIFADNFFIDKAKNELVLRNPQVVNGGQTLKALFSAFDKHNRIDNSAKILLRIYKLPYDDTTTYKRSIEIISALNSQNKINPSDLKSTDPRQVRLGELFKMVGYTYIRKRSNEVTGNRFTSIKMRDLALRYYVCKRNVPHEGVSGKVEELFEEESKYNEIFDENAINKEMFNDHIIIRYVTCWRIDQIIKNMKKELPKRDRELFNYTKWFVLVDIYNKVMEWKQKKFNFGWRTWIDFLQDPYFESAIREYSRYAFRVGSEIVPLSQEPRSFFKTKEATNRFNKRIGGGKNFEVRMNKVLNWFQRGMDVE